MNKETALETLETIRENINICCAITMDPEDVIILLDILKEYIETETKT